MDADWRVFEKILDKEGIDPRSIGSQVELRQLMAELWHDVGVVSAARARTWWQRNVAQAATPASSPSAPPPAVEEQCTVEALYALDESDWSKTSEKLGAALSADPQFVPALVLATVVQRASPPTFSAFADALVRTRAVGIE
jgi:hypothetical protein